MVVYVTKISNVLELLELENAIQTFSSEKGWNRTRLEKARREYRELSKNLPLRVVEEESRPKLVYRVKEV